MEHIYGTDRDGGLIATHRGMYEYPHPPQLYSVRECRVTPGRGIDCQVVGNELEFRYDDVTRFKLARILDADPWLISWRCLDRWTVAVLIKEQ